MPTTPQSGAAPTEFSAQEILDMTIAANQMAANDAHVDAYRVRNAVLLERKKNRVRYLNGYTSQPAAVVKLLANAEDLAYNHRRTLARNIAAVDKAPRPAAACAHHIVALADKEALQSRLLIFSWGIGINDGDNGVFLPRDGVGLPGVPNAAQHTPYHHARYHFRVWMRLKRANDSPSGRQQLRSMKADLLAGRLTV